MRYIQTTLLPVILALFLQSCTTIKSSQASIPEDERTFSAPYEEVYASAVESLMVLRWQISHSSKEEGLIQARTPMTLWTWGDLITIHVVETKEGNVRIGMTSGSPQQFDWGKNQKNIDAFYSEMRNRISE